MPQKFSVLIPDGESPFAYHVLSCLAQAGNMDVHLLSREVDVMSRYSRAKKSFHVIDPAQDYLGYLKEFCSRVPVDLILPVDMNAILYFAERREAVEGIANVCLLDDLQDLCDVDDKGILADFLQAHHLPHPRSITSPGEFNKVISQFPIPALVKPRTSGNGEGISKYADRAKLEELVALNPHFFDGYMIQEYMDGYDVDCSMLCRDGVILAHTTQKSLYVSAKPYQPAEGIEFVHDAQVYELAVRLAETLHWNGIIHVDMRRRAANGQVEIIEINPRFWGSIQGSLHAGVNFPLLACLAGAGREIPSTQYRDIKYMNAASMMKRLWRNLPVTHLIRETNFLSMLQDPMPNLMKLLGRAQ
jgi:D-aspartate ligase